MIPTNKFFDGHSQIEYEGKLYAMIYTITDVPGKYRLHFEFISTDSEYEQSIGLNFYQLKGKVFIGGKRVKLGRGAFASIGFAEYSTPKQFDVEVEMESGDMNVYNSMEGWHVDIHNYTPDLTPAMIVEKIDEWNYVFHCNDRVYDDDFNDLVFSLSVTKLE